MESFSEACANAQIRFRPWGFAPLDPLPGLCPGPTGGLGGPLDPQPNLLFSKMTLLFHFIMKTLPTTTLSESTEGYQTNGEVGRNGDIGIGDNFFFEGKQCRPVIPDAWIVLEMT